MISNYIKAIEDYFYNVSLSIEYPMVDYSQYTIICLLLVTMYQLYKMINLLHEIIRIFTKKSNSIDSTFDDIYSEFERITTYNQDIKSDLTKVIKYLSNITEPTELQSATKKVSNIIVDAINSYK
jgi:hypothetical protein